MGGKRYACDRHAPFNAADQTSRRTDVILARGRRASGDRSQSAALPRGASTTRGLRSPGGLSAMSFMRALVIELGHETPGLGTTVSRMDTRTSVGWPRRRESTDDDGGDRA